MLQQVISKSKEQPFIPISAALATWFSYTGWKALGKDPIVVQRSMRYRVGFTTVALGLMVLETLRRQETGPAGNDSEQE